MRVIDAPSWPHDVIAGFRTGYAVHTLLSRRRPPQLADRGFGAGVAVSDARDILVDAVGVVRF
jgi:hypothetical protein